MKRSPIARRTPLRQTSMLQTLKGAWSRPETNVKPSPTLTALPKKRKRTTPRWTRLRAQVFARDGGCCVVCGRTLHPQAWECHHRQYRSRGGRDVLPNLIAVCMDDHRRIHMGDLSYATAAGWAVPAHRDPATTPVRYFGRGFVLLTADGTYQPYEEAA